MTSLCKAENSDKDQWENQGGFFEFPGDIKQCAILLDKSPGQLEICVDSLFKAYSESCRSCMDTMVSCVFTQCGSQCVECISNFNIACDIDTVDTCEPRCITPNNTLYDAEDCQNCISLNCNDQFATCSGYSAEFCANCINPDEGGNPDYLIPVIAAAAAVFGLIGIGVIIYVRLKTYKRGVYDATKPKYMSKLVSPGKKSLSTTGQNQFNAPRAQTVPPGLGYTQPPRPEERQYMPTDFEIGPTLEEYPQFIVAYSFEAENVDELDAEIGEPVLGLSQIDENWWMVQNERGQRGLIPTDFLREPEDEELVSFSKFSEPGASEQKQTITVIGSDGQQLQQDITFVKGEENDDEEVEPEF